MPQILYKIDLVVKISNSDWTGEVKFIFVGLILIKLILPSNKFYLTLTGLAFSDLHGTGGGGGAHSCPPIVLSSRVVFIIVRFTKCSA